MRRFVLAILLSVPLFVHPAVTYADYVFPAFPDLPPFALPIGIEDPLDGTDHLFVPERDGTIYVIQNDATVSQPTLFLDVSGLLTTQSEGGLLGLAFHPNYENNRFFYVTYTAEGPRREVLARFTADATNPNVALPGSQFVILEVPKGNLFHNGGCIEFGPDGYLYWTLGEDGQSHLAQDINSLHGKMLRIDVNNPSGGNNYGIPASNPFVGVAGLDEIYALGFRNPWRFSIDVPTGRIWLGDVGQDLWEEINIIRKGRNYGWPRTEGSSCFPSQLPCDTAGLNIVLPLYAYPHNGSASITGGFVYRGPTMPSLVGKYIYADYITGEIHALSWNGVSPPSDEFLTTLLNIPSFGVDKNGELFIASFDGDIYRLFATTTGVGTPSASPRLRVGPNPFPDQLSVSFSLEEPAHATLEIFDVAGRRVATLMDREAVAGTVSSVWNGRDASGRKLGSGVYFLRLNVDGKAREVQRITLLK